jgi:hypothetical protein
VRRFERSELISLGAILLFALAVRVALIDRPFHRDPEGCGSFYGLLARNYWRYDLSQTLGVPVMSMGVHENPTFYPNHPPLVPLLIAGVFGVAGYSDYQSDRFPPDWLVRLPTVPFTLGCVVLIWLLLCDRASPRAGLIAACLFAATPMTLVFGGLVDVISPQLVFFVLLTVAAYLRLHDRPSVKWLALTSLALLPAGLTDWPAFFLVPVLGVHFLLTRPPRQWGWIVAFGLVSVVWFMIPYVQVVLVTHDWMWMKELFRRRAMSNVSDAHATFTAWDWVRGALYGHAIARHSWPVMILGTMWVVWALARWRSSLRGARVTGILLGWAALHIAVGRQGVFVHEWWWWPLTPGVAMAAGLMLERVCQWLESSDFRAPRINVGLTTLLVLFAAWHTRQAFLELGQPRGIVPSRPDVDYTIVEVGHIICASARPNEPVMLAENDPTLSLWYYADRPLRTNVWDPYTFEQRLTDGSSELCFRMTERFDARPAAFVFPKAYRAPKMEPLFEYLSARFPLTEHEKFYVFDLRQK